MLNYAFIFARGGSKGLPKKNIKPLMGKELIRYSIEIAASIKDIDKIFVSTDDAAIAEVAKTSGADIILRPDYLASDESAEWLSWKHAVDFVRSRYGEFDHFISLPATAPLRSKEDVENALAKFQRDIADVCLAVSPSQKSPYFNMVTKDSDGMISLAIEPISNVSRRQDAPPIFDITTVVYVTTPEFITTSDGLSAGKITSIEVPKDRAVDIDDIYDFMMAEAILKNRKT